MDKLEQIMAHILIVDDDELIAEVASDTLINAGHGCGWVTSGEKAWALLNAGTRPDLVMLDQSMPGISGINLLRRIRNSPKLYDLPVIMFTAMSGKDDEARAIFAGAQDFLRKPFNQNALVRKVEYLMASIAATPRHKPLQTWLAENSGISISAEQPQRRMV